jgi:hypothetical protein
LGLSKAFNETNEVHDVIKRANLPLHGEIGPRTRYKNTQGLNFKERNKARA